MKFFIEIDKIIGQLLYNKRALSDEAIAKQLFLLKALLSGNAVKCREVARPLLNVPNPLIKQKIIRNITDGIVAVYMPVVGKTAAPKKPYDDYKAIMGYQEQLLSCCTEILKYNIEKYKNEPENSEFRKKYVELRQKIKKFRTNYMAMEKILNDLVANKVDEESEKYKEYNEIFYKFLNKTEKLADYYSYIVKSNLTIESKKDKDYMLENYLLYMTVEKDPQKIYGKLDRFKEPRYEVTLDKKTKQYKVKKNNKANVFYVIENEDIRQQYEQQFGEAKPFYLSCSFANDPESNSANVYQYVVMCSDFLSRNEQGSIAKAPYNVTLAKEEQSAITIAPRSTAVKTTKVKKDSKVFKSRYARMSREAFFVRSAFENIAAHKVGVVNQVDLAIPDNLIPGVFDTDFVTSIPDNFADEETVKLRLVVPFFEGRTLTYSCFYQNHLPDYKKILNSFRTLAVDLNQGFHSKGNIHGDIKPQNVIQTADGLKLIDCDLNQKEGENRQVGTRFYRAKEYEVKGSIIAKNYDVYSFGVLLWEAMVYGTEQRHLHPYRTRPKRSKFIEINKIENPIKEKDYFINFLSKLLRDDPAERLTDAQAIVDEIDIVINQIDQVNVEKTTRPSTPHNLSDGENQYLPKL